jgi:amino acid adenylation domain-containing protein/non-ribosomal peptide synthase protein (TIGR01720 family)
MSRPIVIEDIYPLSPLQSGLLFHALFEPRSEVYFEQLTCELHGKLDEAAFAGAWRLLMARHAILRTAFVSKGQREPVQVVHRTLELPWRKEDWRELDWGTCQAKLAVFLAEDRRQGFEPNRAPLIRLTTLWLTDSLWQLVLSHHHLLLDGWSFPLLLREFSEAYDAHCARRAPVLPPARPYSCYLAWLRQRDLARAEVFWREELRGFATPTPLNFRRPDREGSDYATAQVLLSTEQTERLRAASRKLNVTLNTLVQGAYAIVLSRYSGLDDVVFGISVAGRPADLPGVETIVGLFTNTLPLRVFVPAEAEVASWLRSLQERQLTLQEFDYSALGDIQRWSEVPHGQPLFESLLVFENYPVDAALSQRLGGLEPRAVRFVERNNYALTVIVLPGEQLGLRVSFDTVRLDRDAAERLLGHLGRVLDLLTEPAMRLDAITIVTPNERAALLGPPAVAGREDLRDGSLHAWFARQAKLTPSAVAVAAASGTLTYRQLDRAANRIAWRLRGLGIGRGSLVGLFVERDAGLITGLLGILKAGGAYVPLDPVCPDERLAFMVADSRAAVVVTQRSLANRLGGATVTLELDGEGAIPTAQDDLPPCRGASPDDAAYVIYTSGSTGNPKGCVITHRNVLRLFTATEHWFGFGPTDVWTVFHSAAFDFSVWEIWGALLYGGRVVVVPYLTSRDPAAFCELLMRERVTILNQTPSAFQQLMQAEELQPNPWALPLRFVIFGGEALELGCLHPWFLRHGDKYPRLINMYGITETTVHVTYRPLRHVDALKASGSFIGVPIPDLRLLILDRRGHLTPIGVPGELYVAGAGLARGYLEQPELTAERFVPDPFGVSPGSRLYRTGDFALRLSDGDIEYLGRIDDQVKIRGFRIELGEIERILATHPAVRSAVVLARQETSGEKRLVAYAVPREGSRPSVVELRMHLRRRLVEYMVPSAFVWLDALPLTPNGKVDRRALPDPERSSNDPSVEYVAPRNHHEGTLAEIWREVLGVERVGVRDNYFALGGDSIRSIKICVRAKEQGLNISLQDLFEKQTIESLLAAPPLPGSNSGLPAPASEPLSLIAKEARRQLPADVEDAYPLTRLQAGMLFHSCSVPGDTTYLDLFSHHLRGPLNMAALQATVDNLVQRHAVLRTSFDIGAMPEPLQRVHAHAILPVAWTDISDRTSIEQEQLIDAWIAAEKAFDWTKPPLLRFHVHRRGREEFQFSISMHHAILDGWSLASLTAELFHDYLHRLGLDARAPTIPPAPIFREFVALERAALEDETSRRFWIDTLAGAPVLSLPRSEPTSAGTRPGYMHLPLEVPTDVAAGLTRLAERLSVPLKTLLLAAHVRVLSLVGRQEDVLTGLVTNCRPEVPDGERVVGLFLNTLPLRVRMPHGDWTDLVRAVFQAETNLLPHRRVPLAEIQKRVGGAPLIDTDFNFVHFHVYDSLRGLDAIEVLGTRAREDTNFAVAVNFGIEGQTGALRGRISCSLRALDARVAAALPGLYEAVLCAMVTKPETRWWAVPLIAAPDRELALQTWNDTGKEFFAEELLNRLFEAQAERTPDALAVEDDTTKLTYAELDRRSNQLAHWLLCHGVGPEVHVGVALGRSTELVVALLGVLKAGASYIPLDPGYPAERIAWMIADSGARFVLADGALSTKAYDGIVRWADLRRELIGEPTDRPDALVHPETTAYVIYTSGSTGRPKGVVVPHRAIVNHMLWMQCTFPLSGDDAVLQKTPISFDASVWEFWAPLIAGARLVMAREDGHHDPAYLAEAVRAHRITTLQLVPSILDFFLEEAAERECPSLRRVFSGGEVLRSQTRDQFYRRLGATLINLYGPTEAAIDATFWVCEEEAEVPIGRPVANVQAYILDPQLEPVPPGVTGELYLGGVGLARGYLNQPQLTAERFLPDPFSARPGARIYRTGDLARHRADGAILYAGRVDGQVKIRGHRIEPGEIEEVLLTHSAVERAVLVAHKDGRGEARLVAYVVPHSGVAAGAALLLAFLRGRLPEPLVPAVVMFLERLPLNPNGKIDRRALPAPDFAAAERMGLRRTPPGTPLEKQLADLWRSVLGVDEIGIHDNFFELGGDSIQSLRLVSLAGRAGWKIGPKQVFDHPTISGLARVAQRVDSQLAPASTMFDPGNIPLSPIQRQFFALEAPNPHYWNQAVLVQTDFSSEVLEYAWKEVARRHAAFRLRFARVESGWRQLLEPEVGAFSPPFVVVNLAERPAEEQRAEFERHRAEAHAGFDIGRGPVARALFFDYGPGSHGRLLLVAHHLCIDGVSWRILLEELAQACVYAERGAPVEMPPEELSFPAWAAHLPALAASEETRAEAAYWIAVTGGQVAPLPLDSVDGCAHNLEMATDSITWKLGSPETACLIREVPVICRSRVEELLLAALQAALQEWTGQGETLIHLEHHGREETFADTNLARAVGWFTTIFPLRLGGAPSDDTFARLRQVKETLRRVPRHGFGYGLLSHCGDDPGITAALSGGSRPEVSFNYLGQFDSAPSGPFQPAPESAGQERAPDSPRAHLLDVIAMITGGCLRIQWLYCKRAHRRQTVDRAARRFGVELQNLIEHASENGAQAVIPADFELAQLGQAELARICARKGEVEDIWPLTPLQEGMLVHAVHDGESGVYGQQIAVDLHGALDLQAFEHAWRDVTRRHAALRLEFIWDDLPAPRQLVRREVLVELQTVDWSAIAAEEQPKRLSDWLAADRQRGFNLEKAPLWRVTVMRLGPDHWRFVWSHHHLLLDGWSLPVVFRDLLSAYTAARGAGAGHSEPASGYRGYLAWLAQREPGAAESFWRNYLAGYKSPPALEIGPAPGGDRATSSEQGSVRVELSRETTASLREFAQRQQLALSTCVGAAWAFALSRWLGTDEAVFGLVVGGRPFEVPGAESMVGLFINTLPLRVPVRRTETVAAWLRSLHDQVAALRQFEHSRLVDVHGWSEVLRGRPLFESVVIFENYPVDRALALPVAGLEFGAVESFERTNFPLNFYVLPGERLELRIDYFQNRFYDEQVAALADEVAWLLECLPACANARLGMLTLLRPEAARKVATLGTPAMRTSWDRRPVHERISLLAASQPEAIAVAGAGRTLHYGELEARSNQLAHHLGKLGAGPGQLVGVCLNRSPELVVALLGVLKSGAAYVPIDPSFPPERLAMMREDSGIRLAIIDDASAVQTGLLPPSVTCVRIDADAAAIGLHSTEPVAVSSFPAELAYVIFTSGSTGRPKGVQVTHGGLANFLLHFAESPGLGSNDVLLAVTTLSFDIAGLELFLPLVCGARIEIASRQTAADARRLAQELEVTGTTVMQATPATWRLLLADNWRPSRPFRAWCGGEAFPTDLAAALLERGCMVWNFYGPTETTIWSTTHPVIVPADARTIGRPIANTAAYVLDAELNLLPRGAVGELFLAGEGLARGYLGQPGMTAERFVPDPLAERPGGRLYATGDLARWRLDGTIEFLGRRDQQVKIRGFRIELGEIEAALRTFPGVRDAAVALREDRPGEKRLVAYLVGAPVDLAAMREHLRTRLPDYMLPAVFVTLSKLPLTPNGKLDRSSLPLPAEGKVVGADYVAPRNAVEQVLADLWRELLGAEHVGAREHFFELGGHSLLAAQALARIRKIFEVDLPLRTFFQTGTPEKVAAALSAHERVPGRLLKIAAVLLKVRSMSPEERLRVRMGLALQHNSPG